MRLAPAAVLGGMMLLAHASGARANGRLAVIFVAEGQPDVADSLTEIAIARLAEQRGDLVGLRELRGRLPASPAGEPIEACLARGECLNVLKEAAGVDRAVIGRLTRMPENAWRLDLGIADAGAGEGAGKTTWLAPRTLPLETEPLYAGVRAAIDELIPPKRPLPAPTPAPAPVQAQADLSRSEQPKPEGVRVSRVVAASLAGLAIVAIAAASVIGMEASGTPTGSTRAQIQTDLQRREDLAPASTALFAVGGGLALVAAGIFVWTW